MPALNLKELSKKEEVFTAGHRLCDGCPESIALRQILLAIDYPVAIATNTMCLEISTGVYPYTPWKCSWYHCLFENSPAVASGMVAAYDAQRKDGRLKDEFRFLAMGGDGGTYDIGFQALSGAMERGHKMTYICLDNNAYMNTGIQRSGATPFGAWTTTTYAGVAEAGKKENRKDLTFIMAAHDIDYAAQASISNWRDLMTKVRKAMECPGASFINVLSPCWRGWRVPDDQTVAIGRLAVDTNFWPLYEVEKGKWKITYTPRQVKPVQDYMKPQGRFSHFFQPGAEDMLKKAQDYVDYKWDQLKRLEAATNG